MAQARGLTAICSSLESDWRPGWLERARQWRDHLLMSPAFQRWAAAFPLTRWIAAQREQQLFDLCAGFVYTQTLLACVRLRLFQALAEGPLTAAMVAARIDLSPAMAERLLLAATALQLTERRGRDRFGLGPLGAAMLGNPGVAAMVEHHSMLYADLQDPVALLRAGQEGVWSNYVEHHLIPRLNGFEILMASYAILANTLGPSRKPVCAAMKRRTASEKRVTQTKPTP